MGKQKDFVAINMLCMYPNKATVCSVALVKVKNNEVVDEFHSLVNPPEELQYGENEMLQRLHGITEDMTAGAPSFLELLPKIEEFIEGLPLVVHNGITEHFVFVRAMEFYRSQGLNVETYLENARFIDTKKMAHLNLIDKRYEALHDARLYAEYYKRLELEDVLYPEVKKRPDVTKEQMAYAKTKEEVSQFVFDKYDYSQVENPNNIYFGMGAYITGNLALFKSKDDLHLLLRNKLGIRPCKSQSKSKSNKNFILICGATGAGPTKIKTAEGLGQTILQEEELYEELLSMGYDMPIK